MIASFVYLWGTEVLNKNSFKCDGIEYGLQEKKNMTYSENWSSFNILDFEQKEASGRGCHEWNWGHTMKRILVLIRNMDFIQCNQWEDSDMF